MRPQSGQSSGAARAWSICAAAPWRARASCPARAAVAGARPAGAGAVGGAEAPAYAARRASETSPTWRKLLARPRNSPVSSLSPHLANVPGSTPIRMADCFCKSPRLVRRRTNVGRRNRGNSNSKSQGRKSKSCVLHLKLLKRADQRTRRSSSCTPAMKSTPTELKRSRRTLSPIFSQNSSLGLYTGQLVSPGPFGLPALAKLVQ